MAEHAEVGVPRRKPANVPVVALPLPGAVMTREPMRRELGKPKTTEETLEHHKNKSHQAAPKSYTI